MIKHIMPVTPNMAIAIENRAVHQATIACGFGRPFAQARKELTFVVQAFAILWGLAADGYRHSISGQYYFPS